MKNKLNKKEEEECRLVSMWSITNNYKDDKLAVDVDLWIVSGCRLVDRCQWMRTYASVSVDADLWIIVSGCGLVDRCQWMQTCGSVSVVVNLCRIVVSGCRPMDGCLWMQTCRSMAVEEDVRIIGDLSKNHA